MPRLPLIAVCLLVLLAACTSGPVPIEPRTSTIAPTGPAASLPPTADLGMPELPEEAMPDTEAGALAFIEHYIDVLNSAGTTGDAQGLFALSLPDCAGCQVYAESLAEPFRAGGVVEGFEWEISETSYKPPKTVFVEMSQARYRKKNDAQSDWSIVLADSFRVVFDIGRRESTWVVREISRFES